MVQDKSPRENEEVPVEGADGAELDAESNLPS